MGDSKYLRYKCPDGKIWVLETEYDKTQAKLEKAVEALAAIRSDYFILGEKIISGIC